jgi:hypothetical protein
VLLSEVVRKRTDRSLGCPARVDVRFRCERAKPLGDLRPGAVRREALRRGIQATLGSPGATLTPMAGATFDPKLTDGDFRARRFYLPAASATRPPRASSATASSASCTAASKHATTTKTTAWEHHLKAAA